jgi:cytochrome c oxidase subunit 1
MQAVQPAHQTAPPLTYPKLAMFNWERWLIGVHFLIAMLALIPGILMGPFQAFRRSPAFMEMFPDWQIPLFSNYYNALTIHGVMNALFFTTFFIVGMSYYVTQRSLQRSPWSIKLAWVAFGIMTIGLGLTLYGIIVKQSNVLYTFYPPLTGDVTFYLGLTLLIVGTWLVSLNIFQTYNAWRKDNPGKVVALAVYGVLCNLGMWCLATISVTIEVLFMLLPASIGFTEVTDPQLARTLFWFFGHPLVYFWLFIAYISWYTMLPGQAGGKLYSDSLGRVAMLMLAVFSMPVGVHHLFSDPGVSEVAKGIHTVFTFFVAVPSLMTAFNVGAALELAGRRRGAKGKLNWLWTQDWKNPVVAAQLAGLFLFLAGGFSGLIQASFTLNIKLHNTSWVPAHFHMTLASAVTLTIFSVLYWIVPIIRGKALWSRTMALAQIAIWTIGMVLFGHGMGAAGLGGVPRRTDLALVPSAERLDGMPYVPEHAAIWLDTTAIGAALLLVSAILVYLNLVGTLFFSRKPVEDYDGPIATEGDQSSPLWLERWGLWIGITLLLALIAWGPVFITGFYFTTPIRGPMG